MKHLLLYLGAIFLGLLVFVAYRKNQTISDIKPIVRVYASSSFISQWGPGPWLKSEFEKKCNCKIEYHEAIDSYLLMQKIRSEGPARGVDLVLGLDDYDLEMAERTLSWKVPDISKERLNENIRTQGPFYPYDYSQIAIVYRRSEIRNLPKSLQDLALPQYKNQIALIDPRSSSLGLQFISWIVKVFGEEKGFELLNQINQNVKVYAANWSAAYGLFRERQVNLVLSYTTSPLYHRIEEKNLDIQAAQFQEGHPLQIEYLGIPQYCHQCELALEFAKLILSDIGQKIIMEKNYMFPVRSSVKANTLFDEVPPFAALERHVPSLSEREKLIRQWNAARKKINDHSN
jgi:thiamine transport system substrate-binding protein